MYQVQSRSQNTEKQKITTLSEFEGHNVIRQVDGGVGGGMPNGRNAERKKDRNAERPECRTAGMAKSWRLW